MVCPLLDWLLMGRSATQVSVKNMAGFNVARTEPQATAGYVDRADFVLQAAAYAMLAWFRTGAGAQLSG